MIRRHTILLLALAPVLTGALALPGAAAAQITEATVAVRGMSCPFCAFGVEKKLKAVPGTAAVEISMREGTATLAAREGASIDIEKIPEAVRKAGFTPGELRVVARGTVRIESGGEGPVRRVLEPGGGAPPLLLVNLGEGEARRIGELAGTGEAVRVRGRVHFHAGEAPGLEPAEIEAVR